MAQFDCYRNPNPQSQEWAPYLVDLQHTMLESLNTRIMAPLVIMKPSEGPSMRRLNPLVTVEGHKCFLSAAEMAAVPVRELAEPITNLSASRDDFLSAVDMLFTAV